MPSLSKDADNAQSDSPNQPDDLTPTLQQPVYAPVVEQRPAPVAPAPEATVIDRVEPRPVAVDHTPQEVAMNPQATEVEQPPAQLSGQAAPTEYSLMPAESTVAHPFKPPEQSYGPVTAAQAAGVVEPVRVKKPPKVKKEIVQKEQHYTPNTTLNKTDSQILLLVFAVFLAFLSGIGYFIPLLGLGIGVMGLLLIILLRHQSRECSVK